MASTSMFKSPRNEGKAARRLSAAIARALSCCLRAAPARPHGLVAVGACLTLCIQLAPGTENSKLGLLYNSLLAEPSKPVFVAFEREILVPKRPPKEKMLRLPDGREMRLNVPDKDFFAFFALGQAFIISYSGKSVVTNLESLLLADELTGFDGDDYWSLSLNHPITFGSHSGPAKSINRLKIIPKTDMGGYSEEAEPPPGANIMWLAAEGYSVAQLGCRYRLRHAPVLHGELMSLDVDDARQRNLTGRILSFAGTTPTEIEYTSMLPGTVTRVELDPQRELMVITQRAAMGTERVLSRISYRLCSASLIEPEAATKAKLSWRAYYSSAGELRTIVSSNRVQHLAAVTNQHLILGPALVHPPLAANMRLGTPRRFVVIAVIGVISAGALWLSARRTGLPKSKKEANEE